MIKYIKYVGLLCVCLISTVNLGKSTVLSTSYENPEAVAILHAYASGIRQDARHAKLDSLGINSREYLCRMGQSESGNTYNIRGGYKGLYLGKYQFAPSTIKRLRKAGYLDLTDEEVKNFLTTPEAQEKAVTAYILASNDFFKKYHMDRYVGRTIGGVKITKAGMLAASHLVGPYAVVHYVRSGGSLEPVVLKSGVVVMKTDGFGISMVKYMKAFQDC